MRKRIGTSVFGELKSVLRLKQLANHQPTKVDHMLAESGSTAAMTTKIVVTRTVS